VIAARGLATPDPGQLRACGLAAAAEAGLLALPTHLVLDPARTIDVAAPAFVVAFVPAYVVAALVACRFRGTRNLAAATGVLAILVGMAIGDGGLQRTAFAVVVAMLLALRVVSLAGRDWRTPVHAELGWWATILGVETLLAAGLLPSWRPALLVVVPLAFACALGSRATTVWSGHGEAESGGAWVPRSLIAAGALAVAMAAVVGLASRAGLFGIIGRVIRPLTEVAAAVLVWLVVQAARPIFWLAERFGVDPEGVREFLERLRAEALQDRAPSELPPSGSSPGQRLLGLLIVAGIAFLLYRVLRRWLSKPEPERPAARERPVPVETGAAPDRLEPPSRWRFRPELPADAVRRLYAEVLLDLRERRVVKDPWLTPAEFVPVVATAFPGAEDDLRALTAAYQDVRYGSRRLGRGDVRALEARQRRLRSALRPSRNGVGEDG
jgi:hypothetical protein